MTMLPYFVGFMAMACYALMGPIAKMTGTNIGPFSFIALASFVLTVIAAGVAYAFERNEFSQSMTDLKWNWMALYIVVNFISYAGYIWAIGRIPVAQFEMFGIFVPVIGGFFAWWILKEPFHMRYFLALAFMAVGIVIAIGPELRGK